MQKFACIAVLFFAANAAAVEFRETAPEECPYAAQMANGIFWAEGGVKARAPYGILSVRVYNQKHARLITLESIQNNWNRWKKAGQPGDFVSFMAARWVPVRDDPAGHYAWIKNVKYFLKCQGISEEPER